MRVSCHRPEISCIERVAICVAIPCALSAIGIGSYSLYKRALMLKSRAIGTLVAGSTTVAIIAARLICAPAAKKPEKQPPPPPNPVEPVRDEIVEESSSDEEDFEDAVQPPSPEPTPIPLEVARQMIKPNEAPIYLPADIDPQGKAINWVAPTADWEVGMPLPQESYALLKSYFSQYFPQNP